jgi:hypothetical protein
MCIKICKKNWTECSLAQHRFPIKYVRYFVSSLCLLVRVTVVDKNRAVVCCLLTTSAIIFSEKKKESVRSGVRSGIWKEYTCVSRDAHLLNELLETDVPCDDAIVVSGGRLRKLWDSLSELRSSLCERRLEKTVLRVAFLHVKTAQFTLLFVRYDVTR